VVNIRTAGAASKCSAGNAIRILIRPNSSHNYSYSSEWSKTTIGTPPVTVLILSPFLHSSKIQNNY